MCPLLSIDDGEVTYSDDSRIEGTVATYDCNVGFEISGNTMRTCQENGSWDGSEPTCEGT